MEVNAQLNCADSNATTTEWRFWGGEYYNESVTLGGEALDTLSINIKPRALDYGRLKVCAKTFMKAALEFFDETCGYIEITATPLIAIISGGEALRIPAEMNVSRLLITSADLEVQLVQLNHCDGVYSDY